jgi:glycosyltransferase involved in cell wall biosynthesis
MNVAYNALSLRPDIVDGAATYTLNLLRHLPAACPELDFVVYVRSGETRVPTARNLRVRPVALRGGAAGRIGIEIGWLARELRRTGVAALLSPNESVPVNAPCPVVVIAQNVAYHCDPPERPFTGRRLRDRLVTRAQFAYYRRQMAAAYERATAVVACSQAAVDILADRAGLDRGRTTVVLSGSDSILLPTPGDVEPRERLLVVSTLAPYKKLDRAIELFARMRRGRPSLELAIAGGDWRGFRQEVEVEVARHDLTGAVELLGPVDGTRLAELYASSLALVHLSTCESFGLPLVEAMRLGLPAVAANRGVSPEVAAGAALLVDPDDPAAAAEAVTELLGSATRVDALRRLGRARADTLTWETTAHGIADVLKRVTRLGG